MTRKGLLGLLLLTLTFVNPVDGQEAFDPNSSADPFGRIFSATVLPEVEPMAAWIKKVDTVAPFFIAAINTKDTETSTTGGFSLGYGKKIKGRDVFLNGAYSHVDPDLGGNRDRGSASARATLVPMGVVQVAAVAFAVYDPDAFKAYSVVLVAQRSIIPKRLTATINVGWAELDPKTGSTVSDVKPAAGFEFSPNDLWTFGGDYTFKNNVDGEDTGSFAVSRKIPKASIKLKLTGEKHNSYGLSINRTF
jgi:hypothetical protein